MSSPATDIRLITLHDADAITEHIRRHRETKGRWEPAYPPDYFTLDGQRQRIERMPGRHRDGESWPGVIVEQDDPAEDEPVRAARPTRHRTSPRPGPHRTGATPVAREDSTSAPFG